MSRTKTWEEECLSRLEIRDREGDVALCVLWNLLDDVLPGLPDSEVSPRLSVVGNLRTPLGISWFLRGLGELPNVTTVIVWGSDLTRTGEALFTLWKEGTTADHQIPRFGWRLDPLIDDGCLGWPCDDVTLVDARDSSLGALPRLLSDLPVRDVTRQGRMFPPVKLPERIVFPSGGGFIQLDAKGPADAWIQIQQLLMRLGSRRLTRKGETLLHLFDVKVVMPVPPAEEIGPPFDFTAEDFEAYFADVISLEPPPPGIDYRYGQRMQNWRGHNQLTEVIARLQHSPDTKRATVVLLDPTDLEELEDAPCVALGTFCVRDGVLNSSWVIRSNDMYGGWPSNVLSLLRVHRMVAEGVGVSPLGHASFLSQNAQIYERHLPDVERNLAKWGPALDDFGTDYRFDPDPAGNFIFGVVDGRVRATMTNPEGDQVLLELEGPDSAALVGWIVETMPHLAAQHIRYLGSEEEKLRRALEEGTLYVQG